MADKIVRVENKVTIRVDRTGQLYWDWPTGRPKAKPNRKAPKKRGD